MAHGRSPRLLHEDFICAPVREVVHIDDIGIYTDCDTVLVKYSHDFKREAVYFHPRSSLVQMYSTSTGPILFTRNTVWAWIDKTCVCRHQFELGRITGVVYHPIRDTYLAVSPSSITCELDSNLRPIQCRSGKILPSINLIVPSAYSTSLYVIWRDNLTLNIIDFDRRYQIPISGYCLKLMARPMHPDILVMMNNREVALFDPWHSGASTRQTTFKYAERENYSTTGVHISPNTCLIAADDGSMHVVDYRYGHTRLRLTALTYQLISNLWYIESIGRIYASIWPSGDLYVADV